jgi:hypothetical protein
VVLHHKESSPTQYAFRTKIMENEINFLEMNVNILEKMEELTLYLVEYEK